MRAKDFEIKKRDPNWKAMQDIRRSGAGGQHKDKKKAEKQGEFKHKKEKVPMEGRRDYGYDSFGNSLRPGDDEGSTEPPNNFAIYINGKKWKVFQGKGQYADDAREKKQHYDLKAWAHKKSQETGKKWEVYITSEPATA